MKSSELRASELRIGNITTLGVVSLIDQDVFRVVDSEGDSFKNTWAEIKPIPITEEWLLKFGFEKTEWYFNSYRLVIGNNDYAILIDLDGNCEVGDIITCKIQYVHQLQNLYFALTGEELKQK
jgi:hypothetical protein